MAEMQEAVESRLHDTDVLLMAAAPADFKAREPGQTKLPRVKGAVTMTLEPTDDILKATVGRRRGGMVAVGFALESKEGIDAAREKMRCKQLDLIVLNYTGDPEGGFESRSNRVTLITETDTDELGVLSKREVAERILDRVEGML
jgi:phosphopantothenoylcysteine decarboxylase/phosphopantothenate--cysteine ligase